MVSFDQVPNADRWHLPLIVTNLTVLVNLCVRQSVARSGAVAASTCLFLDRHIEPLVVERELISYRCGVEPEGLGAVVVGPGATFRTLVPPVLHASPGICAEVVAELCIELRHSGHRV